MPSPPPPLPQAHEEQGSRESQVGCVIIPGKQPRCQRPSPACRPKLSLVFLCLLLPEFSRRRRENLFQKVKKGKGPSSLTDSSCHPPASFSEASSAHSAAPLMWKCLFLLPLEMKDLESQNNLGAHLIQACHVTEKKTEPQKNEETEPGP